MGISKEVLDRTKKFEGTIPYIYLDNKGNPTIGVGHLINGDVTELALVRKSDGQSVNADEKRNELVRISALGFPHPATWYKSYSLLEISQANIDVLLLMDLQRMEAGLRAKFFSYDTFAQQAQAGLIDMAFTLGVSGLISKFPKFVQAVNAKDWATAAKECHRDHIAAERNLEIQKLFESVNQGQRELNMITRSTEQPKGISINIGLNRIDKNHYGTDGLLRGCENDARAMVSIATSFGYEVNLLLNEEATALNVLRCLTKAAETLKSGDILLLTYAGHGAQIPDVNSDENDGMDETWCLFDRMLVDDELYRMFAQFNPGVRIFMISDSCHSGTMAREVVKNQDSINLLLRKYQPLLDLAGIGEEIVPRTMGIDEAFSAYMTNRSMYEEVQWSGIGVERNSNRIPPSVILLAACQDNQTAGDGRKHGLFTAALLGIWNEGRFEGGYYSFFQEIKRIMPQIQSSNYFTVGTPNPDFMAQSPFRIGAALPMPSTTSNVAALSFSNTNMDLSIDERLAELKLAMNKGRSTTVAKSAPGGTTPCDEGNDTPLDDIDRRLAKLQGNRGLDESGNSTIFTEKDMPHCGNIHGEISIRF